MNSIQKKIWTITAGGSFLLLLLTVLAFTDPEKDNEKKELENIVTALEAGVSVGNNQAWIKYMADDGILVNRDGNTNTKQEIVDELKPLPKGKVLDIKPINFKIYITDQSAMVSFLADEKLSIWGQVVDTQYPSVMYFEKRKGQWQMIFFSYFEKPVDPAALRVDKKILESYAGVYKVSDEMKIEVSASDSGLLYKKPGATTKGTLLYPIDKDGRFFRAGTESQFIFTKDADGRSVMRQRRNWIDLVWYKE